MPADINIPKPTLYSKDRCVQCNAVIRFFEANQIPYHVIKMETAPQSAWDQLAQWEYQTVPVVSWNFSHFNGFNPDELNKIKAAYAVEVVEEAAAA